MRVMTSAPLCLSDQPTKNLGCLSSLILFLTRIRSKNPATLLGVLSPVCFMWRDINCSTATQIHVCSLQESLDPFSVSHCPLGNRMIEYDLSTSTSCILDHDLQPFSQRSHVLLSSSVRLTLFNYRRSCWPAVLCATSRKHNTLECCYTLFATPSGTAQDLRILLPFDERVVQTFLHEVQHHSES